MVKMHHIRVPIYTHSYFGKIPQIIRAKQSGARVGVRYRRAMLIVAKYVYVRLLTGVCFSSPVDAFTSSTASGFWATVASDIV